MVASESNNQKFKIPKGFTKRFMLCRGGLLSRLESFLPKSLLKNATIDSRVLSANGNFVNYVHKHTLREVGSEARIILIEKSIKKWGFIASAESWIYRQRGIFGESTVMRYPRCVAVLETPFETIVFTKFLPGSNPRLSSVASFLGKAIAEQEQVTHKYLNAKSMVNHCHIDMFRIWYMRRDKYNYGSHIKRLFTSLGEVEMGGISDVIVAARSEVDSLRALVKRSPTCVIHQDYLKKNLIRNKRGLHLIDWSEVRVGRFGVDAGVYLANIFRREEEEVFFKVSSLFLKSYYEVNKCSAYRVEIENGLRFSFYNCALWHAVRKDNFQVASIDKAMDTLVKRLHVLKSCMESEFGTVAWLEKFISASSADE